MSRRPSSKVFARGILAALFLGLGGLGSGLSVAGVAKAEAPASSPSPEDEEVSPEVARRAASIARQTMSPFCPGRTLSDCPSPNAADWRREIRQMVAQGMSASEIQAEFEKRAGGNLSGIPNRQSSYVVPIALSTGAALFLYFVFVRLRRPEEDEPKTAKSKKKAKSASDSASKKGSEGPTVDDQRLQDELDAEG